MAAATHNSSAGKSIGNLGLRRAQFKVLASPARFRVVVAGRRFGKTRLALVMLIVVALRYAHTRNWYVAPTRPWAKDVAWEDLKTLLEVGRDGRGNPTVAQVVETELTIRFKNGSLIQLKGASEPDTLRGRTVKLVVLDEYANMDPELWPQVIRPQLSDRGKEGDALFIGSPRGFSHFKDLYDEVRGGAKGSEWQAWHFTSLDGENITAREILQAKNDLSLRDFRQEYMATFESTEGRIYHAFVRDWYCQNGTFNRGNLDASVHDLGPGMPILVGFDFNVNPLCATLSTKVAMQRLFLPVDPETGQPGRQYEMHTWKEYCLPNAGTADMMKVLREDFPGRHLLVFPDPSGRARHTTSANVGETDHSIIRSFGADIYVPQFRTNSDKFNTVNGLLCNSMGIRRKLINPQTCPQLVKGYDGLTYVPGSNLADKSTGLDHVCDADAYAILGAFPIITDVTEISHVAL